MTIHPVGLATLIVLSFAMLVIPRRLAPLPLLVMICFIPAAQRLVLMGLDFTLMRLMIMVGLVRVVVRSETAGFRLVPLDYAVCAWAFASSIIYTLQQGEAAALITRFGWSIDVVGSYFLVRVLIRGWHEFIGAVKVMAWISIPVAFALAIEWFTRRNVFSVFGGVPDVTAVRQGRLRCQGAFAHPILAGSFWAAILPMVAFGAIRRRSYFCVEAVGVICALWIVFTSSSSTPAMGVIFGIFGAACFFLRHWTRYLLFGALAMLVFLHFAMRGPVWSLIAKVNVFSGSTGYHRYSLINNAINRVSEWWLLGTPSTRHWGFGQQDVTCQYVLEAVRGGLIGLVLFMITVVLAYTNAGKIVARSSRNRGTLMLAWGVLVALFVHTTTFVAVSYFGQIVFLWSFALAAIASLSAATEPIPLARIRPAAAQPDQPNAATPRLAEPPHTPRPRQA